MAYSVCDHAQAWSRTILKSAIKSPKNKSVCVRDEPATERKKKQQRTQIKKKQFHLVILWPLFV